MRKDKSNNGGMSRENRTDFFIGLGVVLAVFAVFAGVIVFAGTRTGGEIAFAGETTRGNEQTFSYKSKNLKKGDTVTWYVNGQKATTYRYDGSGDAKFAYVPTETGTAVVRVQAGNISQSKVVNVKKPTLTVRAKDTEMTYGDTMPQLTYECEGLVCDDTSDCVECELNCENFCNACGEYEIAAKAIADNYNVTCQNGTLTVKPREISIKNGFEKVYDQTSAINVDNLELDGILDGDEVNIASVGKLSFGGKNVGTYTVSTDGIALTGKDSANYVLEDVEGKITPKEITLCGLTVANKSYDGTTKATIDKMGTLKGVCEGDSVAVGSLDIAFESADVGKQKIEVKNAKLVGYDKDNYTLKDIDVQDAEITE